MNEDWTIDKVEGKNGDIHMVHWGVEFSIGDRKVNSAGRTYLNNKIPFTSSEREIIKATHKAIGDIKLERIRLENKKYLEEKEHFESLTEEKFVRDVTEAKVDAELFRRLTEGTTIDGVAVNGQEKFSRNITRCVLLNSLPGGRSSISLVDANGTFVNLNTNELSNLFIKWSDWADGLESSAKSLKGMSPIPKDFKNDSYWQ